MTNSITSLLFVMIPAAAGMFMLCPEITRVIYEGGDFDAVATVRVARALGVYALGLGFFGIQKTMVPYFQAQGDMKTPLKVSVITVVINATLNIAAVAGLPVEWRHVGLAVSTVVCAAIGCVILYVLAKRRDATFSLMATAKPVAMMLFAAVVMALALFAARPWVKDLNRYLSLGLLVAFGGVVYAAAIAPMALRLYRSGRLKLGRSRSRS